MTWFHSPLTDPFRTIQDDAISSVTFFSKMEVPPAATMLSASREALQQPPAQPSTAQSGRLMREEQDSDRHT